MFDVRVVLAALWDGLDRNPLLTQQLSESEDEDESLLTSECSSVSSESQDGTAHIENDALGSNQECDAGSARREAERDAAGACRGGAAP